MSRHKELHYIHEGRYLTINEIMLLSDCKASKSAVYTRLKKGESVQQAIRERKRKVVNRYRYGDYFYTISELTRLKGCTINKHTLLSRLNTGWDVYTAVNTGVYQAGVHQESVVIVEDHRSKEEIERVKKIMAKPIKNRASYHYYAGR